jgi:hypothetical protein
VDLDPSSTDGAGFIYFVVDNEHKLSAVIFAAILGDKLILKLVNMALYLEHLKSWNTTFTLS